MEIKKTPILLSSVAALSLGIAACGSDKETYDVNEGALISDGVLIETESLFRDSGECYGRVDTVVLSVGEFAILGDYLGSSNNGWVVKSLDDDTFSFTEKAEYAKTALNPRYSINDAGQDMTKDSPVFIDVTTLPEDEAAFGSYSITSYGRADEVGSFLVKMLPDADALQVSIRSNFEENEDWCINEVPSNQR